jgi:hypothetical protein
MQRGKPTVIIVATPSIDEAHIQPPDISAVVTTITRENLKELFSNRNLAFLATLSKDGSPPMLL